MIKYFLTAVALVLLVHALREWKRSRAVALGLLSVTAVGVFLIWHEGAANRIANILGVGRAADLVFYTYCALSFLLILNVVLKQREQHDELTRLARHIALSAPLVPKTLADAAALHDKGGQ